MWITLQISFFRLKITAVVLKHVQWNFFKKKRSENSSCVSCKCSVFDLRGLERTACSVCVSARLLGIHCSPRFNVNQWVGHQGLLSKLKCLSGYPRKSFLWSACLCFGMVFCLWSQMRTRHVPNTKASDKRPSFNSILTVWGIKQSEPLRDWSVLRAPKTAVIMVHTSCMKHNTLCK